MNLTGSGGGVSATTAAPRPNKAEIHARAHAAVEQLRGRMAETPLDQFRLVADSQFRTATPELMDLESTPVGVKRRMIEDVDRINRVLRIYPRIIQRLEPMIEAARLARRGKPVRIMDVGSGSGGLTFAIWDWARKRRMPVEIFGVDVDEQYVAGARRKAWESGRRVDFHKLDARELPIADGGVDVAVTQFVLHHLEAGDVAVVLSEMDRVAAVNWLAVDLRRNIAAFPVFYGILRVLGVDATTRHDGIVSFRKGYTRAEVERMVLAAGLQDIDVQEGPLVPIWTAQRRSSL